MISPEPSHWVGERHPLSPRTWRRIAVALASTTLLGIGGVAAIVLFGADFDRPTVLVTNDCADPLYLDNAVDGYTIGAGSTVSVERAGTGASYWRTSDRPYGSADAGTIDLLTPTTIVGAGCPEP